MTNGTFTTFNNNAIRQTKLNVAPAVDLRGKTVEVYLPSGKQVASLRDINAPVKTALGRSLIHNLGLKSGVYVLTVRNNQTGAIIFTSKQACFR